MDEVNHAICEMCYDIYWEPNGWPEHPTRVEWEVITPEHFPAVMENDKLVAEPVDIYAWCCFCRDGIDDGWGTDGVIYVKFDQTKLSCEDLHKLN